tara:strand:+ start:19270 stop:20322 length:1053 start_codon:yes stop_codon:yes gene_type:complete
MAGKGFRATVWRDRNPDLSMRITPPEARQIVQQIFGAQPDRVEWPGGRSRKTFIVVYAGKKYVVSRRSGPGRARLEATALEALGQRGLAPVLLHLHESWVVQSYIPGERLAELLAGDTASSDMVAAAARSLALIQRAAAEAGLNALMPVIGARDGWVADLLAIPSRIAAGHGWPEPQLDLERLEHILSQPPRSFVKWDARPGNAVMAPVSRQPVWIDWEHAGLRVAADDLAWLVCDEWFPAGQSAERVAIDAFKSIYADQFEFDFDRYLRCFGVFHMLVRASLILGQVAKHGWGDETKLLALDQIGSVPSRLITLCERGQRWSALEPALQPLAPLFASISEFAAKPGTDH